jgi:hypothetical protein
MTIKIYFEPAALGRFKISSIERARSVDSFPAIINVLYPFGVVSLYPLLQGYRGERSENTTREKQKRAVRSEELQEIQGIRNADFSALFLSICLTFPSVRTVW